MNLSSVYDGLLFYWETRHLTSYTADQMVLLEDFDLADVALVAPGGPTLHYLPVTFQWIKRFVSPDDSYQFNLFSSDGQQNFETSLLGYVDSYILNQLPSGFITLNSYYWTVIINSPGGGVGIPYYSDEIAFSNASGTGSSGATPFTQTTGPIPSSSIWKDVLNRGKHP
jgi:hypothetical protein